MDEVIARQPATAAFVWMGTALHLNGRLLCGTQARTGGLGASDASLSFPQGSSTDVIQLPGMKFSKDNRD